MITPQQFGAHGDGVNDDTVAMQTAHDTGKMVFYPAGKYLFSNLVIKSGGIVGESPGTTLLYSNTQSEDAIKYVGTTPPLFEKFHLQELNIRNNSSSLHISPESGIVSYATIFNVSLYNSFVGIKLTNAVYGNITNSTILNYADAGVVYDVPFDPAAGDFLISNNTINTGKSDGRLFGILQNSGGGVRVSNNKILGGNVGFVLGYSSHINSGPLLITGNSIENTNAFGVYLGASGTGTFESIVITGNEIAQVNGDNGTCISTDNSGKLSGITISGNVLQYGSIRGTCVSLLRVNGFTVNGNSCAGSNTPESIGISINPLCKNGSLHGNSFVNINTNKYANPNCIPY